MPLRLRKDNRGQRQQAPYRARQVMRLQAFQMEGPDGAEIPKARGPGVFLYKEQ